jgi:DNA-nicking Smr family endonuclease
MASDKPEDEFRKAVAGAKPLRHAQRVSLRTTAVAPVARQRQNDDAAVLAESLANPPSLDDLLEIDDDSSFLRDGVSRQALRKLRRGQWTIEAGLDLHGHTREQTEHAVAAFLERCLTHGKRCVRIVHGKGTGMLQASCASGCRSATKCSPSARRPRARAGGGVLLVA